MKVLLYNMTPEQQFYVDQWNQQHPADQLVTTDQELDAKSVELAAGYDAVSVLQIFDLADEEIYRRLTAFGIKHLALRSVGYNIINWQYVHQYHMIVTNTPAYSPRAVAENTLTSAMYLLRKWGPILKNEREDFNFIRSADLMSDEIYNQTVGIIGAGRIGSAVGEIFHALGARVIAYDLVENPANEAFLTYTAFEQVIQEADILTLHTPYEPGMADLISAPQFKQMKNSAYIINAARGPLVNTQDLIAALKNHEIAGAALDVVTGEEEIVMKKFTSLAQLPDDYQELAHLPNVVFTPHSAYYTKTAVKNMLVQSMTDIKRVLNGQKPIYAVEN